MADIQQYLDDIMEARYGEEVRGSIHDAIEKINNVSDEAVTEAKEVYEKAQEFIGSAEEAQKAADRANTAADRANTAADNVDKNIDHGIEEKLSDITEATESANDAADRASRAAEGIVQALPKRSYQIISMGYVDTPRGIKFNGGNNPLPVNGQAIAYANFETSHFYPEDIYGASLIVYDVEPLYWNLSDTDGSNNNNVKCSATFIGYSLTEPTDYNLLPTTESNPYNNQSIALSVYDNFYLVGFVTNIGGKAINFSDLAVRFHYMVIKQVSYTISDVSLQELIDQARKQLQDSKDAENAANEAAQEASLAAHSAQQNAEAASQAASSATTATESANNALNNAIEALRSANEALSNSQQSAENAENAAKRADDSSENAVEASRAANEAADEALRAAEEASKIVDQAATKEYVDQQIDAVEIGGTNLYTGTKDFSGDNWTVLLKNNFEIVEDKYMGFSIAKSKNNGAQGVGQNVDSKANEEYVFSAYLKSDQDNVNFKFWSGESAIDYTTTPTGIYINVDSNWKRYSIKFKTLTDCKICPRIDANTDVDYHLYICGIKVERGNKATDWSPSPDDLSSSSSTSPIPPGEYLMIVPGGYWNAPTSWSTSQLETSSFQNIEWQKDQSGCYHYFFDISDSIVFSKEYGDDLLYIRSMANCFNKEDEDILKQYNILLDSNVTFGHGVTQDPLNNNRWKKDYTIRIVAKTKTIPPSSLNLSGNSNGYLCWFETLVSYLKKVTIT